MALSNTERLIRAMVLLLDRDGTPRELPSMAQIAETAGLPEYQARDIFATPEDLIHAIGIGAWMRLYDAASRAMSVVPDGDPMEQLARLGETYLDWAFADPPLFRIINSRSLIKLQRAPELQQVIDSMRRLILSLLSRATQTGALDAGEDPEMLLAASRGLVYGLARMHVDDHFAEWTPDTEPQPMCKRIFRDYIGRITRSAGSETFANG